MAEDNTEPREPREPVELRMLMVSIQCHNNIPNLCEKFFSFRLCVTSLGPGYGTVAR